MESWICSSWIYLWMVIIVFESISPDPIQPAHYIVHHQQVSFQQAMELCSPAVLTTLSTQPEVSEILGLISESLPPLNHNFTFWVGLRKVKDQCVVPDLRLRGFMWVEDGSQESEVIPWAEDPEETCVTMRCAALKGEFDGKTVTRWGLIPVKCKTKYQFICKLSPRKPAVTPAKPEPATPESPEPSTAAPNKPESRPGTPKPEPQPELPLRPETETHLKPDTGPELQGPDGGSAPGMGQDQCEKDNYDGIRFYIDNFNNKHQVKVECWSSHMVDLHCSGHPLVWRLLDDSPANMSAICHPCEPGFQKDALGNCVDVDECSVAAPCRHTCLNTEGSYKCVCSDKNEKQHVEDSEACRNMTTTVDDGLLSGVLIPVLIAVAAFVVLVVVVAVTVKCCLMRRSKKRAMKKAEKMAMKIKEDKDSFQTTNEKTAT